VRREAGFSLVEILVAMFIAALAAAAVVASLPPSVPGHEQAAQRLAAALTRAQRAAVVDGATVGVFLAPREVRFAVWAGDGWRALGRDEGLAPVALPAGALLGLRAETVSGDTPPADVPTLVFDATGGAAPFRIRIDTPDGHAVVDAGPDGAIRAEAPDA
jgi:general secretion pathway protein H